MLPELRCFSPGTAVKFNCTLELLTLHTSEVLYKRAVQVSRTCNPKSLAVGTHGTERCVAPGCQRSRSKAKLDKLASVQATSVEIAPNAYLFRPK